MATGSMWRCMCRGGRLVTRNVLAVDATAKQSAACLPTSVQQRGLYGPIKHAYTIKPEREQMSVAELVQRTAVYCGKYLVALHKDRFIDDPYHGRSNEVVA